MIAFVRGRVAALAPDAAVLEVGGNGRDGGGVGLSLQCTPGTLARLRLGEAAHLPASMVVREDSLTLYGFLDDDERQVFELLQTASGVGPRLAQAMLAVHPPEALRRAVATDDLAALTQVPGIGRKGAQRIVLELRDRLGSPSSAAAAPRAAGRPAGAWTEQLAAALVGLGWAAREADAAITAVRPEAEAAVEAAAAAGESPDVGALLRLALRTLSRS